MNDHVAKPIEPQELYDALLKWVQPRAGIGQAPMPPGMATPEPGSDTGSPFVIEGVQVASALRRMRGNATLYRSMLSKFVAGQRGFAEQLSDAIDGSDWPTAIRLAHTLKGLCASIGAQDLASRVESLEQMLAGAPPRATLTRELEIIGHELAALIGRIEVTLGQDDAPPPVADAWDPAELAAVVARLQSLLADSDALAFQWFETHAPLLRAAWPAHVDALQLAADQFDTDDMMTALRRALTPAAL
jgi:two-component system sensor histidine kinase/response regulator